VDGKPDEDCRYQYQDLLDIDVIDFKTPFEQGRA
jgi:hypothetical protein